MDVLFIRMFLSGPLGSGADQLDYSAAVPLHLESPGEAQHILAEVLEVIERRRNPRAERQPAPGTKGRA